MKWILITCLLAMVACSKKNETTHYPACVQTVIDNGSADLTEILEYRYNNQTVYLFGSACCDRLNFLYDVNCRQLCAPTGGISGQGDGRCNDFIQNAVLVKTVWKR